MVSLTKGQTISLAKSGGGTLTKVVMGLGWDVRAAKRGLFGPKESDSIDLDASCLLFDASNTLVDTVWFSQLRSKDGSIVHTGDNRTGAGDGDDEQIVVDLTAVPAQVRTLVFTVNSFQGQTFERIENAFCRLVDQSTNAEMARFDLSGAGAHTGQVMAKLSRSDGGWAMKAVGEKTTGRTFHDMMPSILATL